MPDYQQGKIYLIWSPNTTDVYIGSTCQDLNDRLAQHKYSLKNMRECHSDKIIKYKNAEIELIEAYPCNNKYELAEIERWYIENAICCVNRFMPIKTKEEKDIVRKQCDKNRWAKKKEILSAKKKERYQANKEILLAKQKAYYQANKQSILDKEKERYAKKKLIPS